MSLNITPNAGEYKIFVLLTDIELYEGYIVPVKTGCSMCRLLAQLMYALAISSAALSKISTYWSSGTLSVKKHVDV